MKSIACFLPLVLAIVVPATPGQAAVLVPGPVDCSLGDGHCYQEVALVGNGGQFFSWAEVSAYAGARSYGDKPGHLLTLDSQAEYDSPLVPKRGYLGAEGESNGPYAWVVGPSAGTPVQFFGPFLPAPVPGTADYCRPFTRLCHSGTEYYGGGERARLPSSGLGCPCEAGFVVEYEPDTVAPAARVVSPNGDDLFGVGERATLAWEASDAFGSIAGVDLHLSRSGPSGPFEELALGLPNTGSYDWIVTGPPAEGSAYLRVTARDAAGNTAIDLSDAGFRILQRVPTLPATWGRLKVLYR